MSEATPGVGGSLLDGLMPEGRVPVVRPDGSLTHIAAERLPQAEASGYRFQTPAEQKAFAQKLQYGGHGVKAAALGAADALTMGASTAALPALGLTTARAEKGYEEQNKGAYLAGQVGGTAASLLVPGLDDVSGPGLVSKLGRSVERGVVEAGAEKVAAKILAGGVEGTFYGAQNAVHDAALGDPDMNAQKLIGHLGLGFALGSAGAGASEALEGAAGAGMRAIGKSGLDGLLTHKAEDFGIKAIGAIQSDLKGLEREEARAIARDVMDAGLIGKTDSPAEILPKISGAKEEAGKAIGAHLAGVDKARVPFDFDAARQRIRHFYDGLNPAEQDLVGSELEKKLSQLDRLEQRGGGFADVNDLKSTMQGEINYKADPKAKLRLMKQAVGIFRDEIDSQMERVMAPEAFEDFAKQKKLFGSFSEAEKWATRGVRRIQGNRKISLTDHIIGAALGAATHGPLGVATGLAGAVGNKLLRERGPSFAANMLDALAEHPALSFTAKAFGQAISSRLPALGEFGPPLANAFAHGPIYGLMTHVHLAKTDPAYAQQMALAGFPPETAEEAGVGLDRAHDLSTLEAVLAQHDDETESAVEKLFRGSDRLQPTSKGLKAVDFGAKSQRKSPRNAHEAQAEEVLRLAASPEELTRRVAANLEGLHHAPNVSAATAAAANRAVQYLAAQLKKPQSPAPLAPKWTPSGAELSRFTRQYRAVMEPMTVLHHAATGSATPDELDAVRAVYPKLYASWQRAIAEKVTQPPKKLPHQRRQAVALMYGSDLDGSLSPRMVARNQLTYRLPSGKQEVQQARQAKASLTLAERTQTAEERRTGRE